MRKNKLLILLLIGSATTSFAQVGIGTPTPNASSMLDIDVTSMASTAKKGLLPPRLSTSERNAIIAPAEGLMVYNTTTQCLEFYNGGSWICQGDLPKNGAALNRAASTCRAIKDNYPALASGIYWLDADGSGPIAPSQAYCDMTTDGGGWTLIGVNGSSTTGTQAELSTMTSLTAAGYLPKATVIGLATNSSQVQLRSGASSTSYANKITSRPGGPAILALRSTATVAGGDATWHRSGAAGDFVGNTTVVPVGTWTWTLGNCTPTATGWPLMYQSCGNAANVQWLFDTKTPNRTLAGDAWASTWIR